MRTTISKLASAFSFVLLTSSTSSNAQNTSTSLSAIDTYISSLNQYKGIKILPTNMTDEEKNKLQVLRTQFPGADFIKLRHLQKYIAVETDHASFDKNRKELTTTILDIGPYQSELTSIYINPLSSWPTHSVLTFNGFKPDKSDICLFVPNSEITSAKSVHLPRSAIDKNFKIDWEKSKQSTEQDGTESKLAAQQVINVSHSRLPLDLFDMKKLTCVIVEMPDSTTMKSLSGKKNSDWSYVITGPEQRKKTADTPQPPTQ